MLSPTPPAVAVDSPVYVIADLEVLGEERFSPAVEVMAEAGIRWIQIRAKKASGEHLFHLAEDCSRRLRGRGVSLWIDDRADVAGAVSAYGVHVGQRDLPPAAVRQVLGPGPKIGQSTHDRSQVEAAAIDPHVDVIAVGPVFPTVSKENPDPAVGLDLLRRARRLTSKPIVAIGGISTRNLGAVLDAGADAVAVLGAVCRGDVEANCRQLLKVAKEGK